MNTNEILEATSSTPVAPPAGVLHGIAFDDVSEYLDALFADLEVAS